MNGTQALPLFALTVLAVNATPGVDLLLTVSRTLALGVRGGVAAAAGIAAGCAVHAGVAAFGLAALLAASAAAFTAVKLAGAAYLVWLAFGLWRAAARRAPPGVVAATTSQPAPTAAELQRVFLQGLFGNVLNPKVAMFFLAFLPQFIVADAPHKTAAFLFLGGWFVLQGFAFLLVVALLVAPLRRRAVPDAWRRGLQATAGTLFAALALRLALVRS